MRYFNVSVEESLGIGIGEIDDAVAFENVVGITEEMNENLNRMGDLVQRFGKIHSVIKSGQGYKAIILYRGDFTGKKRREAQRMIQDALEGKITSKQADETQPSVAPEASDTSEDYDDRPVYEIKFGIVFADIATEQGMTLDAAFKVVPYETMEDGELKSCIDDGILAEFDVPYHPPIEEDKRIYALNFHVAGRESDDVVIGYAMQLQPYARQLYLDFKHLAKPMNPFEQED